MSSPLYTGTVCVELCAETYVTIYKAVFWSLICSALLKELTRVKWHNAKVWMRRRAKKGSRTTQEQATPRNVHNSWEWLDMPTPHPSHNTTRGKASAKNSETTQPGQTDQESLDDLTRTMTLPAWWTPLTRSSLLAWGLLLAWWPKDAPPPRPLLMLRNTQPREPMRENDAKKTDDGETEDGKTDEKPMANGKTRGTRQKTDDGKPEDGKIDSEKPDGKQEPNTATWAKTAGEPNGTSAEQSNKEIKHEQQQNPAPYKNRPPPTSRTLENSPPPLYKNTEAEDSSESDGENWWPAARGNPHTCQENGRCDDDRHSACQDRGDRSDSSASTGGKNDSNSDNKGGSTDNTCWSHRGGGSSSTCASSKNSGDSGKQDSTSGGDTSDGCSSNSSSHCHHRQHNHCSSSSSSGSNSNDDGGGHSSATNDGSSTPPHDSNHNSDSQNDSSRRGGDTKNSEGNDDDNANGSDNESSSGHDTTAVRVQTAETPRTLAELTDTVHQATAQKRATHIPAPHRPEEEQEMRGSWETHIKTAGNVKPGGYKGEAMKWWDFWTACSERGWYATYGIHERGHSSQQDNVAWQWLKAAKGKTVTARRAKVAHTLATASQNETHDPRKTRYPYFAHGMLPPLDAETHFDDYDNTCYMLMGTKYFWIMHPQGLKKSKAKGTGRENERLDIDARAHEGWQMITAKAGDVIIIPAGWWHYVTSEPQTLMINIWHDRKTYEDEHDNETDDDDTHNGPPPPKRNKPPPPPPSGEGTEKRDRTEKDGDKGEGRSSREEDSTRTTSGQTKHNTGKYKHERSVVRGTHKKGYRHI